MRAGQKVLSNPDLTAISKEIQHAIEMYSQDGASRILLVIDQLDLLLATGGGRVSAVEIEEILMGMREVRSIWQRMFFILAADIIPARSCNRLDSLSRWSLGIKPADSTGIKSCCSSLRRSSRGRFYHELKAFRLRHSKRC